MKKNVIKNRFVMLLINSFDKCEKVNEKVKSVINKNMREDVVNFNCEIISIHNIDIRNVVNKQINETNI